MFNQNNNGFQKSLYIFLSSLLGMLLFLIIHRLVVFCLLILQSSGNKVFTLNMPYLEFLAWDYFSLLLTLLAGAWYGIWVGSYWYEKVYNEGSHLGLVGHITENYWPKTTSYKDIKSKISEVKKTIHTELWQLEDLNKTLNSELSSRKKPLARKKVIKRKTLKKTGA